MKVCGNVTFLVSVSFLFSFLSDRIINLVASLEVNAVCLFFPFLSFPSFLTQRLCENLAW